MRLDFGLKITKMGKWSLSRVEAPGRKAGIPALSRIGISMAES